MKIENWGIVLRGGPYQAPEQFTTHLVGAVYGHPNPRHYDGKHIQTSAIVSGDPATETVTTRSGSVYELGEVAPEYEKQFPGARERFFSDP